MEKTIRKAVRCYLIKNNKIVVIQYKKGNRKEGYYDIPGGKMEAGETPEQAAIREMKEETGINVKNLTYKGVMTIEYPDRKYVLDTFVASEYVGEPEEFDENTSEWIEINELLQQEKILAGIAILNSFFIKGLLERNSNFVMNIIVDEQENILKLDYEINREEG